MTNAELIADYIADEDYSARIWEAHGLTRVYVTRLLSRGRRQEIGYVEVLEDGTAHAAGITRRQATVEGWVAEALA